MGTLGLIFEGIIKDFRNKFFKTTYFYNPVMEKGPGPNGWYMVGVYKHQGRKNYPVVSFTDKNPRIVMKMVHRYVNSMRDNK